MSANSNTPQPAKTTASTGAKEGSVSKARRRPISMSAQATLRWRAVESLRPADQRVSYDPAASKLMGPFWSFLSRIGFIKKRLIRQLDREESGVANWIVGRTQYIDDFVKTQIEQGMKQLVILGAGYDTRAYRLQGLEGVRIFELDHLATLRFKVARARIALRPLPKNLVYVPIDFAADKLEAKLVEAIYDRNLRTLFIWEGVSMYLTANAVDQTLAFIAGNAAKGSCVVFDYLFESVVDGSSHVMEAEILRRTTTRLDEPLLFGIKEDGIEGFLSSRGFDLVRNLTGPSLKDAYFKGDGQKRKVFPLIAIVSAKVR
jgi:methyltransferase (TIGR00027 family)